MFEEVFWGLGLHSRLMDVALVVDEEICFRQGGLKLSVGFGQWISRLLFFVLGCTLTGPLQHVEFREYR